jgi:hypothetical protein
MYNRFGVQEAPGLLKEGGGVMKKIQSESLSQKLPAVIKEQYPAFLNNGSIMVASCTAAAGGEGFRMHKKGGEQQFVSDQKITEEKKYFVISIRRMEVKQ